ncbi:MAG: SDR family oxidoreductase [Chloroflexota bacterium]
MKTIVITGSTRGIGFGLAQQFLERGCKVVVNGRSRASVDKAVAQLGSWRQNLIGISADITEESQVQTLWDSAAESFSSVDIWLNNAALNAERSPTWELNGDELKAIINASIIGTLNGCNVAIRGMLQQGYGHIYNFKGLGSGGEVMRGNLPYGLGKAGVAYIHKALLTDTKDLPIQLNTISPGMVMTDLMQKSVNPNVIWERRFLNILGDQVETVTPYLAKQILKHNGQDKDINWLPTSKLLWRFLKAPFTQRDLFVDSPVVISQS